MKIRGFEPVYGAPEDTIMPYRATDGSAGYDFFAPKSMEIGYGFSDTIWLNVKAYMQPGEFLNIKNRSSYMANKNAMLFCSGLIDSDYYSNPNNDGNIGIRFLNLGSPFIIQKGDKICQGVFETYLTADGDDSKGKRQGGFGSTGR